MSGNVLKDLRGEFAFDSLPDEALEPAKCSGRWSRCVDEYLRQVDRACAGVEWIRRKGAEVRLDHPLVEPDSRMLVRVTVGALVVVFAIVLCSCQATGPRELPLPHVREPIRGTGKDRGQLYTKRETVRIAPKESGSKTGSIWADTRPPRDLYAEARPGRTGEVITVAIPDELRYVPPAASEKKAPSKGEKGEKGRDPKKEALAQDETLRMTDPYSVGVLGSLGGEPVKEFRMEIVGMEPTGDVFLRGTRNFQNNVGESRMVAVLAKVPKRALQSYTVDARDLTAVTVNEDHNGDTSDYATTGWDKVVSRKLSGFIPDIDAELAALEDVRQELQASQQALREQQQAIREERERLVKERDRQAGQVARTQNPQGAPPSAQVPAAPAAKKEEQSASSGGGE